MTFTTDPAQKFTSIIDGERYDFSVTYNPTYKLWSMTIERGGEILAAGINLVTNTNLTEQFPGIPFDMISSYQNDAVRDNIGQFEIAVTLKNG